MSDVIFRDEDQYEQFSQNLKVYFGEMSRGNLFTTNVEGLFDTFLSGLPDEARQHYTCNDCRRFVDRFGGLVTIDGKGKKVSAVWSTGDTPPFFMKAVKAVLSKVNKAEVTGVFLSKEHVLGTYESNGWRHMAVALHSACVLRDRVNSASQVMASKGQDYLLVEKALNELSLDVANKTIDILSNGSIYRGARFVPNVVWFKNLHEAIKGVRSYEAKRNLVWLAVANAPEGYTHIRGNAVGSLMQEISEGLPFEQIKENFERKIAPENYQRTQVAPTVGGIREAEKLVEKLGIKDSLKRRYLGVNEISEFVWAKRDSKQRMTVGKGVFAGIEPKKEVAKDDGLVLPIMPITWEKFKRLVLPSANKVEVKVEQPNRFAALVTAVNEGSENILQWNNPVSWYYHAGVDGEIKRRVEREGGKFEGNEIRCSLMWNTYSDLDIHVEAPYDGHIYFASKKGRYGYLDVDMNVNPESLEPVENLRWVDAPQGRYRFYVNNYRDRHDYNNPYTVELEVAGKIYTFNGVLRGTDYTNEVVMFEYKKGIEPVIRGFNNLSNGSAWGLEMNKFYNVEGIVKSPNLWGDEPVERAGNHTFFLIDGCKDGDKGQGRGFFNEMLKGELREIRKTLEAYTAANEVEDIDGPVACGLGFSKDGEWNLTVRVTNSTSVALYKIDRFD